MLFIIVFQDVKKAILEDMTMKGNEGKLNSFEQVSPFAGSIMHTLWKKKIISWFITPPWGPANAIGLSVPAKSSKTYGQSDWVSGREAPKLISPLND